jgi:crossover junction endodeoxyribonuclease RusA
MREWLIHIIVPLEPITVNHYAKHTRSGRHYKTKEALTYEQAGAIACRGHSIAAKRYSVRIEVYQGKGNKGDLDNYLKQPLDLLVKNGVIHSDSAVVELVAVKARDIANPRTEIFVGSA